MPEESAALTHQYHIIVNGNALEDDLSDNLHEIIVDTTLHLPSMFEIRLHDNDLKWTDNDAFALGAAVEIELSTRGASPQRVISGEITAIEPVFSDEFHVEIIVRGYDLSHRLNRDTQTRVFVQMSDADIVNQIAQEANLRAEVAATSTIYEHVFQHNQTDLEFLQQRARRIGFEFFIEEDTLYFREPRGDRGKIEMEWGTSLLRFAPRLSLSQQVDDVTVKGWDPANKQTIVGQATRSEAPPSVNVGGDGGQVAAQALSSARHIVMRQSVISQDEADVLAQSILDDINAGFIEADGLALGNPQLSAGKIIKIINIGERFSGEYRLTTATHHYSNQGYDIDFRVEGTRSRMMLDLFDQSSQGNERHSQWDGVVPAIVTNNNDPRDMYRVKVKFPWMDENLESHWIRVVTPTAGNGRGFFCLPEVDDEVLVAFQHGDFNQPYVLGSLWNGQDQPVESVSEVVKGGEVTVRTFKSRLGHTIRFVDDTADAHILIQDADGINQITLDMKGQELVLTSQNGISIASDNELKIDASGSLKLSCAANIDIEAGAQLNLKGAMINLN